MASIIPGTSLLKCDFFGTEVFGKGIMGTSPQLCNFSAKGLQATTTMAAKIRLARFGRKHSPFYRILATDSRSRRDGKHLEILGYYNPVPVKDDGKRVGINFERVKYWLSVGAQPSETVERLLFRAGVFSSSPTVTTDPEVSAGPDRENGSGSDEIDGGAAENNP